MAYVRITDTQVAIGKPGTSSEMTTIRNNQDDFDSRISSLFAFGNSGIIDDFLGNDGSAPDAGSWVTVSGGGGSSATVQASSHSVNLIANGGSISLIRAADGRIGMHMANHELTTVMQFRLKESFLGTTFMLGWQDRSLADTGTRATTIANCIGLVKGTGTTWKFRFANAGTNTEVDSLGAPGSWGVFRFTVTCSATAGNRVVRCQGGTTEAALADVAGSPWTNTTSMPTGKYLSPSFCPNDGGLGVCNFLIDYVLAYTTARPLAP